MALFSPVSRIRSNIEADKVISVRYRIGCRKLQRLTSLRSVASFEDLPGYFLLEIEKVHPARVCLFRFQGTQDCRRKLWQKLSRKMP